MQYWMDVRVVTIDGRLHVALVLDKSRNDPPMTWPTTIYSRVLDVDFPDPNDMPAKIVREVLVQIAEYL